MSVVTATIKSDGVTINPEFELLNVDVTHEFNRIPFAEISFNDGDLPKQEFPVSDSNFFEPGKEIEIKLGYEDKPQSNKTVFKGIVTKHGLQMNNSGGVLVVELSDAAIKMTGARKNAVFEDMKDSDIISKLLRETGLRGTIAATSVQHKKIIQYYATNWDFLLSRAEMNGLLISITGGVISAKAPVVTGPPKLSFQLGMDIIDLEMEADAKNQFSTIESTAWDIKKQKLIVSKAKDFKLIQGNLTSRALANAVGGDKETLISAVNLDPNESKAWADARMTRSRLSMLKGSLKVEGVNVEVGDLIELKGVGKRFSGKTLVTAVRHQVSDGGWVTGIQFGLSPDWFSTNANIVDTKAAGLLPGVNGLQVGVVQGYVDDPDGESRVKVLIPALNDQNGIVWSRLGSIDAGKERGVFFYPEPGDEVILGFLNDDPRQSIILGSVYSSANKPPLKPAKKNPEKGIVTRGGSKVLFDDEKKLISISTSDKNIITINEKDKFIEIKDLNNNIIKLSADGILLDSGKDVIIKAKGDVKIDSSKNVEIKGSKTDVI